MFEFEFGIVRFDIRFHLAKHGASRLETCRGWGRGTHHKHTWCGVLLARWKRISNVTIPNSNSNI